MLMSNALKFIPAALAIVALVLVLGQCRKPRGWVGRFYAWLMGVRHANVTTWGMRHIVVAQQFAILDVGCGGGAAIERLAAIASQGSVHGIDYSAASVATARSRNRAAIAEGRVVIQPASVSALPFGDSAFDLELLARAKVGIAVRPKPGLLRSLAGSTASLLELGR